MKVVEIELPGLIRIFGLEGKFGVKGGGIQFITQFKTAERDARGFEFVDDVLEIFPEHVRVGGR